MRISPGRPFFRVKSYIVGIIHGMAGSAALMLLVLASVDNSLVGLAYIAIFGVGSVAAMGLATIFLSLPFSVSAGFPRLNQAVQVVSGIASILFGLFLFIELGLFAAS